MRIVATIPVYNEADIIDQVLVHLYRQGISFVVLDSGSTDDSVNIVRGFTGRGLLEHKIVHYDVWKLEEALDSLLEMAGRHSPDWILHNGADEFLEPREANLTLHDAIVREDQLGYNVIQFDTFEFCLTEQDYLSQEKAVRKKLRYYTWSHDYQYRAWRYYPGATYTPSGGHYPIFPRGVRPNVSPGKLVLTHYRFRSLEQALRKVFKERIPRYTPEARARGWHFHYDHFEEDPRFFILDSKKLSRYDMDGEWDVTKRFEWIQNWYRPNRRHIFGRAWERIPEIARYRLRALLRPRIPRPRYF